MSVRRVLPLPILAALAFTAPLTAHTAQHEGAPQAAVRELEQQCEQAREAKLKPLRDAQIAHCVNEQRKDPDYCQRYWRDYGNAGRLPNGAVRPRLFDDLPQCVLARQARRQYNLEGK